MWPAVVAGGAMLGGALINAESQRKATNKNIDQTRQYAQQGIQWKVADAKAAGINPLAALGAYTHSFQPSTAFGPKAHYGNALEKMGQNTQRAMLANASKQDRQIQSQLLAEQLRTAQLHNQGLELKLQQASNPQGVPKTRDPLANAMNQQGQGNAGNNTVSGNAAVMVKPDEYTPMKQLGVSAATSPLKKHYIDEYGFIWSVLNQEAAESVESDPTAQTKIMVHEGVKWIAGSDRKIKPNIPIPKGYQLIYRRFMNQWQLVKVKFKQFKQGKTSYTGRFKIPLKMDRNVWRKKS